jgi:hypothetical protein
MACDEMTVVERLLFLELAVEELRRELSAVESGLVRKSDSRPLDAPPNSTVPEEHEDLAFMLSEQKKTLLKILEEALIEMDKLKHGSP